MTQEEPFSFYKILGLEKDAGSKEIRKAYLDLAKIKHPDKGGDEEEWKKILTAYEILSDEQKKQIYDSTGRADNDSGPGGFPFGFGPGGFHMDMSDILGGMFHNIRQPKRNMRRPKGPTKTHEIPLPLSDFYNGKKFTIDLARQIFCSECSGNGCIHFKTCSECRGSGVKESMIQIAPGMMMGNRGPCGACGAEGRIRGPICSGCEGKGLINSSKVLEVEIKPGTFVGDVKTFEGMCSDSNEFEKAGDFQLRFVEATEDIDIQRQGINLFHKCEINLAESLLGCKRIIKNHPGFANLEITIPCGTINQEYITVKGKGMPRPGVLGEFGDLIIGVTIKTNSDERAKLEIHKDILQNIFA